MDSTPATPATKPTPEFTAVRRPGRPLTPVLLEAQVNAVGTAVSSLIGLVILALEGPSLAAIGGACAIGLVITVNRRWTFSRSRKPPVHTFHEPLGADARETRTSVIRRQVPEDIGFVLFIFFASVWADDEPVLLTVAAGVCLGLLMTIPAKPRAVIRDERIVGSALLYQRLRWREGFWKGNSYLDGHLPLLVDEPDPTRWGPQDH